MLHDLIETSGVDVQIGQIVIETRDDVSLEDFWAICREHPELRLEQKATGELVIVSPHGARSSRTCMRIGQQLEAWAEESGAGAVFDSNALFLLPDGSRSSPDISLVGYSRWNRLLPDEQEGFLAFAPEFVIEVRSPSDRMRTLQEKMDGWMRNGVELGWLIDAKVRKAWIYKGDEITEHDLTVDLDGSGPVAGFTLSVQRLYRDLY